MQTLTDSPFLKALGWTLLNSLWQFGILWLVFQTFLYNGKKCSPGLKHGFALLLMFAGFACFAAGLSFQYLAHSTVQGTVTTGYSFTGNNFYFFVYRNIKSLLENTLSYFSTLYLLIVIGFFIRFFRFFFYSYTVTTRGLSKMKADLRLYIQQLVQQLDISRQVQVWISELVDTPMVIGFIKPIILIPVACINHLSTQQLEAILLHELAHIKRNDYLVNLFIATIEILFFFNPFARLLIRCIKQEREISCDDLVLQYRFDPYQYASALLSLEQNRLATFSLAIAAAGVDKHLLLKRVQRIMGIYKPGPASGFRLTVYFVTIGLLAFIAFVNPLNVVIENFEKTCAAAEMPAPQLTNAYPRLADNTVEAPSNKPGKMRSRNNRVAIAANAPIEKNSTDDNIFAIPVSTDLNENKAMPQLALLQSVTTDNKDFSIKENEPELPKAATDVGYPFVPNSSYSFFNTEDSALIKYKAEKYKDQTVNESLVQARKAIQKLDWDKIARHQKLSKTSVLKLKKELGQSLSSLDWPSIFKETMDSMNSVSTKNMRFSLKKEYEKMNNYKALQQQFETIKNQLQQRQEIYIKGIEIELNEIDKQVKKKKVIIYI